MPLHGQPGLLSVIRAPTAAASPPLDPGPAPRPHHTDIDTPADSIDSPRHHIGLGRLGARPLGHGCCVVAACNWGMWPVSRSSHRMRRV